MVLRLAPTARRCSSLAPSALNRLAPAALNRLTPSALNRLAPAAFNRLAPAALNRLAPAALNRLAALPLILFAACTRPPDQRRVDVPGEPLLAVIEPDRREDPKTRKAPSSAPRADPSGVVDRRPGNDQRALERLGAHTNTAEALLANASGLQAVEVIALESGRQLATFTSAQVNAVRRALMIAELRDTFVNTTAPWSVALRFRVDGGAVTAILVGELALRVNARAPLSSIWASSCGEPLPGVRELAIDGTLYDLLHEQLGPPSQEHRPSLPIDLHGP